MSEASKENDDEVMCDCSGTTRAKIASLVEKGVYTLDGISSATGANSGCGSCDYVIENFLDELAGIGDK